MTTNESEKMTAPVQVNESGNTFFVSGFRPSGNEQDEREGLPSASGIERIVLCPGSWQAERNLPPEITPEAEEGTRRHKILADGIIPEDASEALENMILRTSTLENEALKVAQIDPDSSETKVYKEERLWFESGTEGGHLRKVLSGKPDKLYIRKYVGLLDLDGNTIEYRDGLIIEFKTMYGDTAPADHNIQLKTLAVLAADNFSLNRVFCALIQPNLPVAKRLTITEYKSEDLRNAEFEIRSAIIKAENIYAPRIPGPAQCRYCRFRNQCPEALGEVSDIVKAKEDKGGNWMTRPVTGGELDLYQMAENIIKVRRDAARKQLENDPNSIPGWRLTIGQVNKKLPDTIAAWNAIKHIVTNRDFAEACTVNLPKLIKLYKSKSGLSYSDSKKEVGSCLKDVIEERSHKPSLRKDRIHSHRAIDEGDLN